MARFFNPNQAPLDFGYRSMPSGGGGGGSDPLAMEKYKRKENERLFKEAQGPIPLPSGDVAPSAVAYPIDSPIPEDQRTGPQEQQTQFDPEKYATALDKSYGAGAGNQYRKQQLEMETIKRQTDLENFRMGAMLVGAGRKSEGLELINSVSPPDQRFKDVQLGQGGAFRATREDGEVEEGNLNAVIESLVSSRDLFNAQQAWKLHLSTKTTKKEPLELKADEVVSANGQVFNTNSILKVYEATFNEIKQLTNDPQAMLLLKSTNPDKYNEILIKGASIDSPVKWAKEVYAVDITGKSPGRTVPAPEAGGKQGAKTPASKGWMDAMPDPAQYKGNRLKSSTGQVLISDGNTWISEDEFKKKYGQK